MKFALIEPRVKWFQCLEDLAACLGDALRRAGHEVFYAGAFCESKPSDLIQIAIGAHRESVTLPAYPVVIYQTEVPNSASFPASFHVKLLKALCVWDSAPGYGTGDAVVEPGLYHTGAMQTVNEVASAMTGQPVPRKDIDLLFYGSLSSRRIEILTKLQDAGLAPQVHFNVFGAERNALVDRAKVVVDIKQRTDDPNDKTRTFFLDSRGACVLTENDENAGRRLDPERIVEQCRALLADPWPRAQHVASRSADLKPTDVSAGIAALERALGYARQGNGSLTHHPA